MINDCRGHCDKECQLAIGYPGYHGYLFMVTIVNRFFGHYGHYLIDYHGYFILQWGSFCYWVSMVKILMVTIAKFSAWGAIWQA